MYACLHVCECISCVSLLRALLLVGSCLGQYTFGDINLHNLNTQSNNAYSEVLGVHAVYRCMSFSSLLSQDCNSVDDTCVAITCDINGHLPNRQGIISVIGYIDDSFFAVS